ncbi:MAG: type 1 glutamine amidotransferase [Eubacteriaceae bacterium]
MNKELKIGWLFSNTFNLHGDRGNMLAIEKEGQRRGYEVTIHKITFETNDFNPMDYDVLYAGPGQIENFSEVVKFLNPLKKKLTQFIENRPLLVTGTTISLFGNEILRSNGTTIKGLDLINIDSKENLAIYGDDLYYTVNFNGKDLSIVGNQIQMVDIDIKEEEPFGALIYGYGNNGKTEYEGVKKGYGVFTNTLGPLLVFNPWFTEEIVNVIDKNKGGVQMEERDNTLEKNSFKTKVSYIMNKVSNLTNSPR